MAGYVVRRLVWAIVLCLALTLVIFVLFYVIPQNSVRLRGTGVTDIEKWSKLHGSFFTQYGQWVWRVAHGSLDRSFYSRRPVTELIANAAPITLSLTIGAAVVWMLIALPLGVFSAMRPRSLIDRTGMLVVLIGLSVHPVWLGLMLSYLLGFRLGLMPLGGYCDMFYPATGCGGPVQWAFHLALPWITFAMVFAALYTRMIRASVAETMHEDFVKQARAKGLSEWQAMRAHVLPNALVPVVAMLAMDIGRLALPTALFVETAFGLPGIGRIFYQAVLRNDLPVLAGVIVVSSLAVVVLNLVADLLYALLDPRVRVRRHPRRRSRYASSQAENAFSKCARGRAPTTRSLTSPPSKRITVGIESTPRLAACCGCSSMFILTKASRSACSDSSSSRTRPTALQGPHHGAQKSTTTGRPAPRTSSAKPASVTSTTLTRSGAGKAGASATGCSVKSTHLASLAGRGALAPRGRGRARSLPARSTGSSSSFRPCGRRT